MPRRVAIGTFGHHTLLDASLLFRREEVEVAALRGLGDVRRYRAL